MELIGQSDYSDWVFFRGHKLSYAFVVLSGSGSGLPCLGLFIVGGLLFPLLLWSQTLTPVTLNRWALGLFLYQTFDAVDGTQAYVLHTLGPGHL